MLNILLLVIASIILVRSASSLVHSLVTLASLFKISEFAVSFILMAVVTSLPEIFVGVGSAVAAVPTLALGNVLGSNVVDLTLIVAIPVLLAKGMTVRSIIARRDALYMLVFALSPIILLLDGTLSRLDGLVLLIFYGFYLARVIQQRTHFQQVSNRVEKRVAAREIWVFPIAILSLFGSSSLLVWSAQNLAIQLSIPVSLVGLFVVAVGTSLPELAFGLKAVELKHTGQVLGNLLGSVVANSTLVLGLTVLISPISIQDWSLYLVSIFFLVIVLILFEIGVYTDKKLDVREGLLLIFVYLIFLLTEFGVQLVRIE